jgi:DNA-binding NarL/FixJ family response regulator
LARGRPHSKVPGMATTLASPVVTAPEPDGSRLRLVPSPYEVQGPVATDEVRVLIAAGHALLRAGYRALLESAADITIAAEASNGPEAVSLAHWSEADVVLLESTLPGGDAMEAIREIAQLEDTKVIVLTGRDESDSALAALRAGASGFLLMDCDPDELVGAVRTVANGEAAVSPSVTRTLIAQFAAQPDLREARDGLEELTSREREVMALAARGLNNVEIGEALAVSRATAKTHVNRAMMKLRARDRAQLVAFAYESGLVASQRGEGALMQ